MEYLLIGTLLLFGIREWLAARKVTRMQNTIEILGLQLVKAGLKPYTEDADEKGSAYHKDKKKRSQPTNSYNNDNDGSGRA